MNIPAITMSGAIASPLAAVPAGDGQSFAQQFVTALKSSAAAAGVAGAVAPTMATIVAPPASATTLPLTLSSPSGQGEGEGAPAATLVSVPDAQAKALLVAAAPQDIRSTSDLALPLTDRRDLGASVTNHPLPDVAAQIAGRAAAPLVAAVVAESLAAASPLPQDAFGSTPESTRGETIEGPGTDGTAPTAAPSGADLPTTLPMHHAPFAMPTPSPTIEALPHGTAVADQAGQGSAATPASSDHADSAPVNAGAERTAVEPSTLPRAGAAPLQPDQAPASPTLAPVAASFTARLAEAYPTPPAAPPTPVIEARAGHIGHDMGVEIARCLSAGKDELMMRLNPAEMGRVEVRLSFDEGGCLRAVVAAESPAALELLRRDTADLARALSDAGVRSDAQSFRFDGRGSDAGQQGQRWQQGGRRDHGEPSASFDSDPETPAYRPLRTSGRVDLIA